MKAEQKLARQRLSVLRLAEALGNVSDAVGSAGAPPHLKFYEYKRRFQTHGIQGLLNLLHAQASSDDHAEGYSRGDHRRPEPGSSSVGCNRIGHQLKLKGASASTPSVQNILNRHGLGTRYERWLRKRR